MAALGLAYAVMESGESNRPVLIDDVIDGKVRRFQMDIDTTAGIVEC